MKIHHQRRRRGAGGHSGVEPEGGGFERRVETQRHGERGVEAAAGKTRTSDESQTQWRCEMKSSKFQVPTSREIPNPKHQTGFLARCELMGRLWSFSGGLLATCRSWCLVR